MRFFALIVAGVLVLPAQGAARRRAPAVMPDSEATVVEIESANVAFGIVPPGQRREYPSAIVVRVRSSQPWALRLVATGPLTEKEKGNAVDWQRLQWRRLPGSFQPFTESGVVVARGSRTSGAGELIVIDLSLGFGPNDAVGEYSTSFRLTIDSF